MYNYMLHASKKDVLRQREREYARAQHVDVLFLIELYCLAVHSVGSYCNYAVWTDCRSDIGT